MLYREQENALNLAQQKSISDYCNRIDSILLKIKSETSVFKKQIETSSQSLAPVVEAPKEVSPAKASKLKLEPAKVVRTKIQAPKQAPAQAVVKNLTI